MLEYVHRHRVISVHEEKKYICRPVKRDAVTRPPLPTLSLYHGTIPLPTVRCRYRSSGERKFFFPMQFKCFTLRINIFTYVRLYSRYVRSYRGSHQKNTYHNSKHRIVINLIFTPKGIEK